jgi:inosine-uridine nucleoside N-ribohydrolase
MTNTVLVLAVLVLTFCAGGLAAAAEERIPVILDTDIGDDIDDTWALVMLLKSPQLDIKLVTTTFGKTEYRAKITAKLLALAGRTDVAVGLGAGGRTGGGGQDAWVKDYKLTDYAGKVHEDGIKALIDTIHAHAGKIAVIAIGPPTTLAEALGKDPSIAGKADFFGMHGSVRKGYGGKAKPDPEWNVKCNVPAAKKVLEAPWRNATITPLDTCGLIRFSGARFETLKNSQDELVKALLENYRMWAKKAAVADLKESSILFDTVAVYLAYPGPKPLVEFETLNIAVTPAGVTAIDPAGAKMAVAINWKDLNAYHDELLKILQAPTVGK